MSLRFKYKEGYKHFFSPLSTLCLLARTTEKSSYLHRIHAHLHTHWFISCLLKNQSMFPDFRVECICTKFPPFPAICGDNFVSPTGVPPCLECQGNTYRLNKTHCQGCPLGTRALRQEEPLSSNCTGEVPHT